MKVDPYMIKLAEVFATAAHAAVGQRRKYTNEPYIVHPAEVVKIVRERTDDWEVLAAAWLHDVLEDTQVRHGEIRDLFGDRTMQMVLALTNVPASFGNRATRHAMNIERLRIANDQVQTIKVADLISNTATIVVHDPKFAVRYLAEKEQVLDALVNADPLLRLRARDQIAQSWVTLGGMGYDRH